MKIGTVLIIGAAGLAVVYILTRSSKPVATASPSTGVLAALTGGAAAGGLLAKLFSSNSGSASVASTGGSISSANTATSNYLADTTATSDDSTGVVGFGGWDD